MLPRRIGQQKLYYMIKARSPGHHVVNEVGRLSAWVVLSSVQPRAVGLTLRPSLRIFVRGLAYLSRVLNGQVDYLAGDLSPGTSPKRYFP